MNFTQFLKTEKMLNESYVADATESVVVGYGTVVPCHIGYLCMVAKLVTLSESHNATPVLVIVERDDQDGLQSAAIKTLTTHFPFLTIQVEENVADPLYRMAQTGKAVKAFVGEQHLVTEANVFHQRLHSQLCEAHGLDFTEFKRTTRRAVRTGDFNSFRASILESSYEDSLNAFHKLKEVI